MTYNKLYDWPDLRCPACGLVMEWLEKCCMGADEGKAFCPGCSAEFELEKCIASETEPVTLFDGFASPSPAPVTKREGER